MKVYSEQEKTAIILMELFVETLASETNNPWQERKLEDACFR